MIIEFIFKVKDRESIFLAWRAVFDVFRRIACSVIAAGISSAPKATSSVIKIWQIHMIEILI